MTVITAAQINDALDNDRLTVKVGRNWWLARRSGRTFTTTDGKFCVSVTAGPQHQNGVVTNIDPAASRDFAILPK